MKTIHGAPVITKTNYDMTHGCDNFRTYVEALNGSFVARKSSGVYVIAATHQTVSALANFAGFNVAPVGKMEDGTDAWIVQRGPCQVVDARC